MILITVPHGKCRSLDGRDCDRRARIFGRYLHRYIPDSVLIENSPYRAEVDGNRIASRATPFRQDIRRALPEASLLLDAHSFPNEPGVWDFAEPPGVPLVVLSMAKTLDMRSRPSSDAFARHRSCETWRAPRRMISSSRPGRSSACRAFSSRRTRTVPGGGQGARPVDCDEFYLKKNKNANINRQDK